MDEWYPEAKVYFDGSHYVAIPHVMDPFRKKSKYRIISVMDKNGKYEIVNSVVEKYGLIEIEEEDNKQLSVDSIVNIETHGFNFCKLRTSKYQIFNKLYNRYRDENEEIWKENIFSAMRGVFSSQKKATNFVNALFNFRIRREQFNELYNAYREESTTNKERLIFEKMRYRFKTDMAAVRYIKDNIARQKRNFVMRRVRFARKAYNQEFNYFVTITYDDKKHTEETFRKRLTYMLNNFSSRKGWRYMGVWERGKKTNRLHFHGLFNIPEGTLSGKLEVIEDYNYKRHTLRSVTQNTFILDRFGRNEFEELDNGPLFGHALAYIMKYLEKTGERIMYSRGLYQYFKSDIDGGEVVAMTGRFGQKLVLFDRFNCYSDGVCLGQVSPAVIMQLEKYM